jgi:hypothetical protein
MRIPVYRAGDYDYVGQAIPVASGALFSERSDGVVKIQ